MTFINNVRQSQGGSNDAAIGSYSNRTNDGGIIFKFWRIYHALHWYKCVRTTNTTSSNNCTNHPWPSSTPLNLKINLFSFKLNKKETCYILWELRVGNKNIIHLKQTKINKQTVLMCLGCDWKWDQTKTNINVNKFMV